MRKIISFYMVFKICKFIKILKFLFEDIKKFFLKVVYNKYLNKWLFVYMFNNFRLFFRNYIIGLK